MALPNGSDQRKYAFIPRNIQSQIRALIETVSDYKLQVFIDVFQSNSNNIDYVKEESFCAGTDLALTKYCKKEAEILKHPVTCPPLTKIDLDEDSRLNTLNSHGLANDIPKRNLSRSRVGESSLSNHQSQNEPSRNSRVKSLHLEDYGNELVASHASSPRSSHPTSGLGGSFLLSNPMSGLDHCDSSLGQSRSYRLLRLYIAAVQEETADIPRCRRGSQFPTILEEDESKSMEANGNCLDQGYPFEQVKVGLEAEALLDAAVARRSSVSSLTNTQGHPASSQISKNSFEVPRVPARKVSRLSEQSQAVPRSPYVRKIPRIAESCPAIRKVPVTQKWPRLGLRDSREGFKSPTPKIPRCGASSSWSSSSFVSSGKNWDTPVTDRQRGAASKGKSNVNSRSAILPHKSRSASVSGKTKRVLSQTFESQSVDFKSKDLKSPFKPVKAAASLTEITISGSKSRKSIESIQFYDSGSSMPAKRKKGSASVRPTKAIPVVKASPSVESQDSSRANPVSEVLDRVYGRFQFIPDFLTEEPFIYPSRGNHRGVSFPKALLRGYRYNHERFYKHSNQLKFLCMSVKSLKAGQDSPRCPAKLFFNIDTMEGEEVESHTCGQDQKYQNQEETMKEIKARVLADQ